jgi:hypothetical protein
MEYNTVRPKMLIPEYGRNVQKMIDFAMSIGDRDERNRAARAIIEVMGQLNPHLRDVDDYRHKLWTHLFIMSDFQLDVDSPYPVPSRESLEEKPDRLKYPKNKIRYGHYGHNLERIINQLAEVSDPEQKQEITSRLANVLKKWYLSYNNDTVENQVIMDQLAELSKGRLVLQDPEALTSTNQLLRTLGVNPNQRKKKPIKPKNKKKR